jgi:hypothetical protein
MKTAVEWFANIISQSGPITEDDFNSLVKQAKEMEYKQIIDARAITKTGYEIAEAEEYYFENYGKL